MWVYRDTSCRDWLRKYSVDIDGQDFWLKPGQILRADIIPGRHVLTVQTAGGRESLAFESDLRGCAAFRLTGSARRPWSRERQVEISGPFLDTTDLKITDYLAQGYKPAGLILGAIFLLMIALFFFVFITLTIMKRGLGSLFLAAGFVFPIFICNLVGRVLSNWIYSSHSLRIVCDIEGKSQPQFTVVKKMDVYKRWQGLIIAVTIVLILLDRLFLHEVDWLLTAIIIVGFAVFLLIGWKSKSSKNV